MKASPIRSEERQQRARRAFELIRPQVDALVLFDEQFIQYYTGFNFTPTERPLALVITRDGQRHFLVPRLELEHVQTYSEAEGFTAYPEYPGREHPMTVLARLLKQLGVRSGQIGIDYDGYPPVMGSDGRKLSDVLDGVTVRSVSVTLDHQMALKSPAEIALIRESVKWGHLAHEFLQRYTAVGRTETEVQEQASREATQAMAQALGDSYRSQNRWISGALALYRGQIGKNSALPHALAAGIRFAVGDTLVTGAGAAVWGYLSELERTMFIQTVSPQQRLYFQHMINLQDIAFEQLKPGIQCAVVDRAVQAYYDQEGLRPYWRHHVGHSLGQRIHESPFLDEGDNRELQPGMVFSIEPGIYVPDLGGFRHSDTVVITESGYECLTSYPRDLHSLIIA